MTIPIALFMGFYLRYLRPGPGPRGHRRSASRCCCSRIVGGGWVAGLLARGRASPSARRPWSSALVVYGFVASVLPVWMLLAPRDYLSTFMKIGIIVLLAVGVVVAAPVLQDRRGHRLRRATAPGRSSPARCSRSSSSPSPAARCPASTP